MKILHITHHFYPCIGGIETFVKDLCLNLKNQGVESEVLCLDHCHGSKEKLSKTSEYEGIKITRIGFLNLKYYKPTFFSLSMLKEFDAIHVHNIGFFSDYILSTKFIHKKPVIVSTHGGIWHTKNISFLKKIYFNSLQKFLLNKAEVVIADSLGDFELFSKKIKKTILLENAVDFLRFPQIKRISFNENFIYLGRLSRNKNILSLIKTFEVLCKVNPEIKLFIVCKNFDENLEELQETVKNKGLEHNIFFTGELSEEELQNTVEKCTYCVYASLFEGFGISVLELMSSGLIPILNDIPNFRNFVKEKDSGFILDFSNPVSSSEKMIEILDLPKEKKELISQSAQVATKIYSWENKINEYIKLYQKVIAK